MTVPGLPVGSLINIGINLAPQAPQGEDVDTMLILGDSTVINTVERMRTYATLGEVASDFGTSAPEYKAAALWFEQSPQPISLNIGRWANTASNAEVIGAVVPSATQLLSAWTSITNGGFFYYDNSLTFGNRPKSVTGLNFSAATNLNGVSTIINAAIIALGGAEAAIAWNAGNQQFILQRASLSGPPDALSFLAPPTASGAITFTGNPTANDTVTLNGTVITFVAGAPSGSQVQIAGTAILTAATFFAFLSASADVNLILFKYGLPVGGFANPIVTLAAATAGVGGNALTVAKSSTAISISGATLTGGGGTDISAMLGMNATSSGAYLVPAVAAESALAVVELFDVAFSTKWFGLAFAAASMPLDSDYVAVAGYIEGTAPNHYFGITTAEGALLTSGDTSNIAYQLKALGYSWSCVQYSSTNVYAVTSYLARILTTDWPGQNTTITLAYKQEPGIIAESLSFTQARNIASYNANVFVNYNNNTAIIQNGQSCSGQYTDTIVGVAWLAQTMQNDLYTALYTTPTKIPQTDAGNHILATIIEADCAEAVNNGLVAPAVWTFNGFGALKTGDFLTKGFYVYAPPVAQQSRSARTARSSVAFQVALTLAGAIQNVSVQLNISQ